MRTIVVVLLTAVLLAGCGTADGDSTITSPSGAQLPADAAVTPPSTGDVVDSDSAVTPSPNAPQPSTGDVIDDTISAMPITAVEVLIREIHPIQVAVLVSGTLSDGCTVFHEATQVRTGTTIEVTITTIRGNETLCPDMIQDFTQTITLEGDFPPGDYTVRVNGIEQRFKI